MGFEKIKNSFYVIMSILSVASILVIGYAIYYFSTHDNKSLNTVNVNALSYTDTTIYPIEINEYNNVFEVKWNFYTDVRLPKTPDDYKNNYSDGVQIMTSSTSANFSTSTGGTWFGNDYYKTTVTAEHYYYEESDGISFKALDNLSPDNFWVIDVDGTLAELRQIGNVRVGSAGAFGAWSAYEVTDVNLFISDVYGAISSMRDGDWILPFKLDKYFYAKIYNGQIFEDVQNKDDNWLFINIAVHKHNTQMVSYKQSLFNMVKNDPNWVLNGSVPFDYYKSLVVYNISVSDLKLSASPTDPSCSYVSLKDDLVSFLSSFGELYISVVIDLNTLSNVNGLAADFAGGLSISILTITSNNQTDFYAPLSLQEAIKTTGVNIIYYGGAA